MKTCAGCNRDDVEFGKNSCRPDGLQSQCKGCKSTTDAAHYDGNKAKQFVRVKNRRRKLRQFIFDFLKTHACVDCGEKDPVVLQFDHIGKKSINISDAVEAGLSIANITKEIKQCEVRCGNCHARRTAKQFGWYKDLVTEL